MSKRTAALVAFALLFSLGPQAAAQDHGKADVTAARAAVRPKLGAHVFPITPELRAHFGAPRHLGVLVGRVETDSLAAKAGLAVGDVITRIDTFGVPSPSVLRALVGLRSGGDRFVIEVVRSKRVHRLAVVMPKTAERAPSRYRYRWPSDLLDPWTNRPVPPDPWDPQFEDRLERRLRELERRMKEMEGRLDERV